MFLPHRKHYARIIDASRLILFREITAVYFESRTKQIFCVAEMQRFLNVKIGGTYSNHCATVG
jgi:hypothetical protein